MAQKLNIADLKVRSTAFDHHRPIPARHTSEGEDISPQLSWSGVPEGTRSFALICHDPDAPLVDGFTHWVAYGIGAAVDSLDEGTDAVVAGVNSAGNLGYNGPAPPPDHGSHHYYFWIYALDDELDLAPGLSRRELIDAIADHVIEQARLVGTYKR